MSYSIFVRAAIFFFSLVGLVGASNASAQSRTPPSDPAGPPAVVAIFRAYHDEVQAARTEWDLHRDAAVNRAVTLLAQLNRSQPAEIRRIWSEAYRALESAHVEFRSAIYQADHHAKQKLHQQRLNTAQLMNLVGAWAIYDLRVAGRLLDGATDAIAAAKRAAELRR